MKRYLLAAAIAFAQLVEAADAIPPQLVGVWVNRTTVMSGQLPKNGEEALYLLKDGASTWLGGQFPEGVTMTSAFDASANVINFKLMRGAKIIAHGQLLFDSKEKTIRSTSPSFSLLQRRFDSVSDDTRKKLGI